MKSVHRLDKVLANLGHGTRKEIKKLVKSGWVTVNGETVKDSGLKVNPYDDVIEVNGEPIDYKEFIYLMMNKPQGVISATEDMKLETVIDLIDERHRVFEPFPVGRLDRDTEGLLLITNDGKLAHELLSPRKHVPKTYIATVQGEVTESDRDAFAEGVVLDDGYKTMPAQLHILESGEISHIELTIHEGKFHQVKRMFEAVGKKVVYLKRVQMGPLQLDENLPLGGVRELTKEELESLKGANINEQK